jgi:hypothetical protein
LQQVDSIAVPHTKNMRTDSPPWKPEDSAFDQMDKHKHRKFGIESVVLAIWHCSLKHFKNTS